MAASGSGDGNDEDEDEEDPLEAFMNEIDASDEVEVQLSVNDLSSRGMDHRVAPRPESNTISLEDLLQMSSTTPRSGDGEGWESDAAVSEAGDEDEDDGTLERDHLEFMRAIKTMRGEAPHVGSSTASTPAGNVDNGGGGGSSGRVGESSCSGSGVPTSAAVSAEESAKPVKVKKLPGVGKEKTGRIFAEEGDVMEEHEREVSSQL